MAEKIKSNRKDLTESVTKVETKKKNVKKVEKDTEPKHQTSWWKSFKSELSKVKWPAAKEVAKYSLATLVLTLIFALFFQGLDLLSTFIKGLFM